MSSKKYDDVILSPLIMIIKTAIAISFLKDDERDFFFSNSRQSHLSIFNKMSSSNKIKNFLIKFPIFSAILKLFLKRCQTISRKETKKLHFFF